MKKNKSSRNAHTSNSPRGMGDFYGSGIRNPMGRSMDIMGLDYSKRKVGKPPRTLA